MSDVMQQTHHKPGCPWLVNAGLYRCTCFPTGAELAAQQKYTEMAPLREIKDKLDKLAEGEIAIMKVLDAIKEQLRTMDAGLHETAMRNHQQLRSDIAGLADAPLDRPGVRKRPKPRGKAR